MSHTFDHHLANSTFATTLSAEEQTLKSDQTLALARARGQVKRLDFGEVYPAEAWALFRAGAAVLIDVRTSAECHYVGRVPGAFHVPWKELGQERTNPHFVDQVANVVSKNSPVLLLCRSAIRSAAAAQALFDAGFEDTFNVLEGFEGDLDVGQQRGRKNGWRFRGLPWVQN